MNTPSAAFDPAQLSLVLNAGLETAFVSNG